MRRPAGPGGRLRLGQEQHGRPPERRRRAGGRALPAAQAEQFVAYLNERAARIQNITYGDVRLRAFENHVPTPQVPCSMACAQPRNFRLKGDRLGGVIDLGSNSDQFWVYVKAAGDPMFVYCSYADFESGRARLPGAMPFEPDWVMQVVGMTTLPPGNEYDVKVNDKERTYTLGWPARTPQGQAVRKEIVFDGDAATGARPQVRRHVVKDAKTGKVVCLAEVKKAQTMTVGTGPVQYPTQITLRWEEQKFEMDLTLGEARLNEPAAAARGSPCRGTWGPTRSTWPSTGSGRGERRPLCGVSQVNGGRTPRPSRRWPTGRSAGPGRCTPTPARPPPTPRGGGAGRA